MTTIAPSRSKYRKGSSGISPRILESTVRQNRKPPPITVLIADDHPLIREGLRVVLARAPDLAVIGEAQDGREAVEMARTLRPGIVLMDVQMPRVNGFEATRRLKRIVPRTRVLILSAHDDLAYVEYAQASGADGFLLKTCIGPQLVCLIHEIQLGAAFSWSLIAGPQNHLWASTSAKFARRKGLTQRETECIK